MSEPNPSNSAKTFKGKGKARESPAGGRTNKNTKTDGTESADFIPPTTVPAPGALRSRAPGRQDVACRGCRRRKIKCDGCKPSCVSCQLIYKEPCIYDKKLTAADALILEGQVTELRSLLGTLVNASSDDRARLLANYASANSTISPPNINPTLTSSSGPSAAAGFKRSASEVEEEEAASKERELSQEDDAAAAMLYELSFGASGEVEHYGVPSFLHRPSLGLQPSPPAPSPGHSMSSTVRSILNPYAIPEELRNHLLDIFFLWQTVHCFCYKPALMRDLDGGPFVNDFLLNVIYAHASRFSDRSTVQSSSSDVGTAGGIFLARAKELLKVELDKPSSIPTAQGLLILGGRECACGNHSQGFLYTAMGLSMAIDLGVQVDGTKVGAASHQDPMDIEVRKRLFWSCYVWDKSISLCLGRAPRFLKGDRQFLGPAPVFDKSEDDLPWQPQLLEMSVDLKNYPFFPFRTGAYFEKVCQLDEIVEGVLLELYAGKRKPADEKSLVRYTALLKKWREDLHPDLVIGPHATISPPPNCVTLSMLHHATIILVNRPFSFGGWGPHIRVSHELRKESKQRCRTAANEIARLLQLYDQTFRFSNMNWLMGYCSYMAATIIVFDMQTPATAEDALLATGRLKTILASLSSQMTVTPSVQRSIETIRHLMDNPLPASGTTTPHTSGPASKRPCGHSWNPSLETPQEDVGFGWSLDPFELSAATAAAASYQPPRESSSTNFTTAFAGLPNDLQDVTFPSQFFLPGFPEAGGPLSWIGAKTPPGDQVDWTGYDWTNFGASQ